MALIAGTEYARPGLGRYSVNPDQLAAIDEVELRDGRGRGMRVYRVRSESGLAFDLLAGRALDIGHLCYKGHNISLMTRNGYCSPENITPSNGEFDHYFGGGMLWTCGLKNAGPNYLDEAGQFQPLHGRIGTLPPEQVWKKAFFEGDEYWLEAGAVLRDTTLEGHNLTLTRSVRTALSKPEIEIFDAVENVDYRQTDYLLLYHFNFGFSFLSEHLKLNFPPAREEVRPRAEAARRQLAEWREITEPVDGEEENVFFHFPQSAPDGTASVALENPRLGVGARLTYETRHLPYLIQWKCVRSGEYALGIEPGNNLISSMPNERAAGRVGRLDPFEKHEIHLKLAFYDL